MEPTGTHCVMDCVICKWEEKQGETFQEVNPSGNATAVAHVRKRPLSSEISVHSAPWHSSEAGTYMVVVNRSTLITWVWSPQTASGPIIGHKPAGTWPTWSAGLWGSVWSCKRSLPTLGRSVRSVWVERERSADLHVSILLSSQAMLLRAKTCSITSCRMMLCQRTHACIYLSVYSKKAELRLVHIQRHGKGERRSRGLWTGRSTDHNLQWMWISGNVDQCIVHNYVLRYQ